MNEIMTFCVLHLHFIDFSLFFLQHDTCIFIGLFITVHYH